MGQCEAGSYGGDHQVAQIREVKGYEDDRGRHPEPAVVLFLVKSQSQDNGYEKVRHISPLQIFSEPGVDPLLEPLGGVYAEKHVVYVYEKGIVVVGVYSVDYPLEVHEV